jgi:hypothetical protein
MNYMHTNFNEIVIKKIKNHVSIEKKEKKYVIYEQFDYANKYFLIGFSDHLCRMKYVLDYLTKRFPERIIVTKETLELNENEKQQIINNRLFIETLIT